MFKILSKEFLGERFLFLRIYAPHISNAKVGQFVMLQLKEDSERIPVFVLETFQDGFSCILEVVGRSTLEIKEEGEEFYYIGGPLGKPFPAYYYGKVVLYSKNWGIVGAINVGRVLKKLGNHIKFVYFEFAFNDLLQKEGFDEIILENELKAHKPADLVVSVGDNLLSKKLSEMYPSVKHIAMPKVYMLCSVGLCLTCRLKVGDRYFLACTDGPWFDANSIDWEEIIKKEDTYKEEEKLALEEYLKKLARKQISA
jgi:ferredoxin--NADP+ reductase